MKPRLRSSRRRCAVLVVGLVGTGGALAGCGSDDSANATRSQMTVTNCGQEASFPDPARRLYVNDANMISMILAIRAQDRVAGISSLGDDRTVLSAAYSEDVVDGLPVATDEQPTLENVIAQKPDVMIAGWSYGYREEDNLTPDTLAEHDIAAYILTESCRQGSGDARGTTPPWEALRTDLTDLGKITGHEDEATAKVEEIDDRLAALRAAPQASTPPTVFLFDSGTKNVLSSGSFGGPQAIIDAAGGRNALKDIEDTWTYVSWERIVAAEPDLIAFVDYPGQTFEEKVEVLRSNPSTKDMPAVKEGRFVNLPYAGWTSGPLNIDAAEHVREALEEWKLVPDSQLGTQLEMSP